MNNLFPVFLRLNDRRALIVGGGTVAETRVEQLLAAGARVTVIAPEVSAALSERAASGEIELHHRYFTRRDVTRKYFLVVGATNDPGAQSELAREAERQGLLYNVVDDVDHCNFFTPAVVERGDLKIAISTNGQSPVLASRLRQDLESALPDSIGEWVKELGALRRRLKLDPGLDFETRKRIIREVIEKTVQK